MLNSSQDGAAGLRNYYPAPVDGPDAEMWITSTAHNVLVSTHGRIFCRVRDTILRTTRGSSLYAQTRVYNLADPPRLCRVYAHHVIAAAFLGPCPHPMVVIFKDNNHTNLSPFNLAYAQRSGVAYSSRIAVKPPALETDKTVS